MDYELFNRIPTEDQVAFTWVNGTYLSSRHIMEYKINLYSVADFYVEVWYDNDIDHVERIRNFKSFDDLKPYLDKIEINI